MGVGDLMRKIQEKKLIHRLAKAKAQQEIAERLACLREQYIEQKQTILTARMRGR